MSQTTAFACPSCQKNLAVPNQHLDKKIRCPDCKTVFRTAIPLAQAEPLAAAPVDDDLFGADPFAQNDPNVGFQNDPFADPSFRQPSEQATALSQPAYLNSGTKSNSKGRPANRRGKKRQTNPEMTEAEQRAFGSGMFLLIVPIVATVLPLMGLQLRRLAKLGDAAPLAGIVLGLVGAGFIAYARKKQRDKILSPALAATFSVIVGVGGFILLMVLHSESDLAQPAQQNVGAPDNLALDGINDPTIDNDLLDRQRSTVKQMQEDAKKQMAAERERQRQFAEDTNKRHEEFLEQARKQQEAMRNQMQNGGGFPSGAGGFPGGDFAPPSDPFKNSGFDPPQP